MVPLQQNKQLLIPTLILEGVKNISMTNNVNTKNVNIQDGDETLTSNSVDTVSRSMISKSRKGPTDGGYGTVAAGDKP